MISQQLEEQSALYASGALTSREREQFELILEFHSELRAFLNGLLDASAMVAVATRQQDGRPSPALKDRIMGQIEGRVQQTHEQGFVMAGPDGFVQWVNPAFTAMCGYELDELRGKKLGPILQGPLTDKAVAVRMRDAIQERKPCTEALVNYHKNGTPYWVSVNITPIHDDAGELLWFVAREMELTERAVAA